MSITNKPYWMNKEAFAEQAKMHVAATNDIPKGKSKIYTFADVEKRSNIIHNTPASQFLSEVDSVTAIFDAVKPNKKVCVLNFASYTHPGGKFLEGSIAQEESLCHESNLYQHLATAENEEFYNYNKSHKNYGFYEHRAIYTEDVTFLRDDKMIKADVLTCASVNLHALKYHRKELKSLIIEDNGCYMSNVSLEKINEELMKTRICFIRNIMEKENVDVAILGAYGCGVFRQDPEFIAKTFKETFNDTNMEVIYAIKPSIHMENINAFRKVFLKSKA